MRGLPLRCRDNMFGNANDTCGAADAEPSRPVDVGWCSISSPGTQLTQAVGFCGRPRSGSKTSRRSSISVTAPLLRPIFSGVNFAGVFAVPCVPFCRNNGWAIAAFRSNVRRPARRSPRSGGLRISGVRVDGNDLFAMVSVSAR